MNPATVPQIANAWLDAIGAIILHLLPLVTAIVVMYHTQLLKMQSQRLDTHSDDIKQVMLQTPVPAPPPVPAATAPVVVEQNNDPAPTG